MRKTDHELLSHNVSGIKNDNIMRSDHGHGGVSTLWRKTLAHKVKPIPPECNRLVCIPLAINDNYKILVIDGYMPIDNYTANNVDTEFDEQMYAKMANDVNDVILVGVVRNNVQTKCQCDISARHGLHDYTYVHKGANHDQILIVTHFII